MTSSTLTLPDDEDIPAAAVVTSPDGLRASERASDPPSGPGAGVEAGQALRRLGAAARPGQPRLRLAPPLPEIEGRVGLAPQAPPAIDLAAARSRSRRRLPSPAAVARDVAMALLEIEAGCRSAAQLERICTPELWAALEQRIPRRGGRLPTGRSVRSVFCQEDVPGLADTVAVLRRGDRFEPVAMRLDASAGRWTVTELTCWCHGTSADEAHGERASRPP